MEKTNCKLEPYTPEMQQTMQDIRDFMEKNEIFNYAIIVKFTREINNDKWFQCLRICVRYWNKWCKAHNYQHCKKTDKA